MKFTTLLLSFLFVSGAVAAPVPHPTELGADLVNPGYEEKPKWFKESFLDIREDVSEAADENRRVILYFYQDGCPYCSKLLNDNFASKSISDKTQKHFDVIAINLWGDREVTGFNGEDTTEKEFGVSLRVQYTPTLLFLDEQGKVILRVNGYFAPHKFTTALDFVSQKQETKMRFRDFYRQAAPIKASDKLHQVALALPQPLDLAANRKASKRPLLALFEQKSCIECDEFHNNILTREAVAYSLTNTDVAQIDMWSTEKMTTPDGREVSMRQWADELDVKFAPSMVFFDSSGKEVFRTEAYLKTFHIHGAIDYVTTGAYLWQPNFQRYLQHRTEVIRARGFEADLME